MSTSRVSTSDEVDAMVAARQALLGAGDRAAILLLAGLRARSVELLPMFPSDISNTGPRCQSRRR